MYASSKSRTFLSTKSIVFSNDTSKLPLKGEKEFVFQNSTSEMNLNFGEFYLCGRDLFLAAANSLSHYLPPHNGSSR